MPEPKAQRKMDETVMPPWRHDLIVSEQLYEGSTFYVIKDPISLDYFRLSVEDYFLATLFDGKRKFAEIREAYAAKFPHLRLAFSPEQLTEKVVRFANELSSMQFLQAHGKVVRKRAEKRKKKSSVLTFLRNIFWVQFSVFDPDELFTRMARPLWWIWTKAALWISIALMAAAGFVFLYNINRIAPTMGAFLAPHNVVLIWMGIIFVKIIHELGHGLTCKHFGGEVHEIGVMMIIFTPLFYVNVTDSWMMRHRRHRIMVAAAGIYAELIIASFATFLWAVAQPGIFQQALFNIMVVTSVWTVMFNANPLMRFDGYYIMVDLLEIPNLRVKARGYVTHLLQKLIFGEKAQSAVFARMPLPERRLTFFVLYAVASYTWWMLVLYRMSHVFIQLLTPYGLGQLGTILSGFVIFGFIVMPCVGFFKGLELEARDWQPGGRGRRLAWIGAAVIAGFAGLCYLPVEHKVYRSSAIELASPQMIRPLLDGLVDEVYVNQYDFLKAGDPIAKLRNREVEEKYRAALLQEQVAEKQMQRAMGTDKPVDYLQAKLQREQYAAAAEESRRQFANLTLRAASDGIVLTADLPTKKGLLIRQGELFCQLSLLRSMLIKIPLAENEVRYVKANQPVQLKAYAHPETTFAGRIANTPLTLLEKDMPPALSLTRGGDVPTGPDREGREIPMERVYSAQISVDNPDGLLRPGMSGRVKIFTGPQRFGKLMGQSLLDLVSLDYRL